MFRRLETDRWLFLSTIALCLVGAVMVFSASAVTAREEYGHASHFLLRQLLWLVLGAGGMLLLMNVDYRILRKPAIVLSGLTAVLLMLVGVFFLDRHHDTHRWISFGGFGLQPSEFAKLAVIAYLAWFLERRLKAGRKKLDDLRHTVIPALGPVLLVLALVAKQPDLGTAIEIFLIALAMLFVAGVSMKYLAAAGAAVVPFVVYMIIFVPWRFERMVSFLYPNADPQGKGFQLIQSLIAVGSGGFTGVGLMESRQKLFYLPEAHTDFIFAVICEELGFIGGTIVLALFAVYAWRGMRAALESLDPFGRLVALGITTMIVSQALINLCVVLGMLPTKGIPLPFISYGGSSLLAMLWATGVLLNISQNAGRHLGKHVA
ncbi:MAG TPA: putative lipid II flippase FtsW [Candidatus Limnocylindrales bacterium]|nr:putative lipid II flippase FtsW [Candidatus Limnocylindrales bacterium]